ncbi:hypothetical protein BGZ73_007081 [Actinomortierella ambigua]|nr:hypothetical protein BGZ73_007081 [Actinomortierella ambigua]
MTIRHEMTDYGPLPPIDDNLPTGKEIFVESPTGGVVGYRTDNTTGKSINIYSHFGRPDIWPRGFPLDDIDIRRPVSYMTEYESLPEQAKNVLAPPMLVQQGLADLDPDVDAIFRLTQVQELTHAKFCKKSPSILSFRVCDIWRGYWVQRLLWDVNGTLGFTKPTVDQIRNAHNYLDDYKDELQIYDQTTQLIDYLASWTSSSTDLSVRIVDLMQGMSKHGFVEQGDVDLARRWVEDLKSVGYVFPTVTRYEPENHKAAVKANEEPRQNRQKSRQVANQALEQCQAEANVDPTMSKIQITGTGPRGETLSAFKDVLLVVNFNHPTYAALEPFLSIYSAYFPNIKVYGPEVPENLKDVVTEIKYDKGWASYHTLADAIEKNPGHKGYMFTNDDALLNVYQLAVYDLDKVWKAVPDPVKDVHDLSKAPPDDWIQWGRPETRPMWADPASFTAEQRARIEKYSGVKGPINVRSFADAAYVPGRIAKELAGVLNNFYKYGVFLEHGLGLGLIASEPTDNWISWNETYLWYDGSRPRWREFLKPGLDMLHPVKFADDPKAKETILDWIETVEVIPQ